jgi:hypothetical protein
MANTLHMGYVGGVTIGGVQYFMTGSSINPQQSVEAPDLVAGSEMRRGWNYSKVDPSGNVTGPLHENATSLWDIAFDRTIELDHMTNSVDVEIAYYQGGGWAFSDCVINSLAISATAGEVVNFTADFASNKLVTASAAPTAVACAKLMTWDRCTFSLPAFSGLIDNLQSINFTINNNVQKLFAIQGTINTTSGLYPVDLPCGVREITGTISAYAEVPIEQIVAGGNAGADAWGLYSDNAAVPVVFSVDPLFTVNFNSVFHRPTGTGSTGPAVYTIGFTAVCSAT